MTSRRSFLQVLGMAPVAAPLAVKAAADTVMAQAVGVASNGLASGSMQGMGLPSSLGASDFHKRIVDLVAKNALPEWYDDHLREQYGYVGALDPDIASKRSWSMNVKISTQRSRNIERGRAGLTKGAERQMRQNDFFSKTGVWL